jgi:Protein of unknown function (DUF3551)
MRLLLFILGIGVALVGIGNRAEAQNYPWCAYYDGGMGGGTNCGFTTLQQRMDTISGIGVICQPNTRNMCRHRDLIHPRKAQAI